MKKQNKKGFHEVTLEEFSNIVGVKIANDLDKLLVRTMDYTKKNSFLLTIINNHFDNSFSIYEKKSKQPLVVIEKLNVTGYFLKPYHIISKISDKILEVCNNDISSGLYGTESTIINDLFALNEENDNDKLSDYLYRLALICIYEFNLDISKSKISYYDESKIIIDGMKYELMYDEMNQVYSQDVIYVINIENNKSFIDIVKIYEDNKKKAHSLDLYKYFMQEYDLINE